MRQRPVRLAPGHWLLLALGCEAAVGLVLLSAYGWILNDGAADIDDGSLVFFFSIYAAGEFAIAMVWLGIVSKAERSTWSWLFAAELLLAFTRFVGCFMLAMGFSTAWNAGNVTLGSNLLNWGDWGAAIVGLLAVPLAAIDRRTHRRDWLHWLGITLLALRLVTVAWQWFVRM